MIDHIPDLTKMIGDTPISDSTPHNVADLGMRCRQLERKLNVANERIKRLEEAFTELEQCNLTDENCANMDVATRRIRYFARRAKEANP